MGKKRRRTSERARPPFSGVGKGKATTGKLKMSTLSEISGYRTIPVPLSRGGGSLRKYLYFKQHHGKSRDGASVDHFPSERTIFVVNLPLLNTKETLVAVFGLCGKVERVEMRSFERKPAAAVPATRGSKKRKLDPGDPLAKTVFALEDAEEGSASASASWGPLSPAVDVAFVVFKRPKSVKKALKLNWAVAMEKHQNAVLDTVTRKDSTGGIGGAPVFALEYVVGEVPADEKAINAWMAEWQADANRKKLETAMESLKGADEDGWTKVPSKGSSRRAVRGGVGVVTRVHQTPKTMSTVSKFYNFQEHQRQKDSVDALRARFEAEKKKIEQMKKERKFKPL